MEGKHEYPKHIASWMLHSFWCEKTSVYILKLCRKIGQSLEESLRGGKLVKNLYFEWIIKQLLNSAFLGCEELCRSRRMLSTLALSLDRQHTPRSG